MAVMHDLNLAGLYFERLALMRAGEVVVDAASHEALMRPDLSAIFDAPLAVLAHPETGAAQVLISRRR
jgi:iron complex transport system ATP-binding protein